MTREETIKWLESLKAEIGKSEHRPLWHYAEALDMAIEALKAEVVPQSEQYKKGFEDAKRAFLVEHARESQNMRKRIAQLEVMLNAQKAISADRPRGEWNDIGGVIRWGCSLCHYAYDQKFNFCPNCGADMRSE